MTKIMAVLSAAILLASCASTGPDDEQHGGGERIGKGSGDTGVATSDPATDTSDESTPN